MTITGSNKDEMIPYQCGDEEPFATMRSVRPYFICHSERPILTEKRSSQLVQQSQNRSAKSENAY